MIQIMKTNESVKDLTCGSVWKGILFLGMPLIASNLLQILFNMSDVAVVGKFAGARALGSVGSTSMLVMIFTTFIIGVGSGINVTVAQAFGRKHEKDIRGTVHTALLISLMVGALTMLFAEGICGFILRLLQTKEELLPGAELYLHLYFLGIPALMLYNYGSAVFSAAGDTRKPLRFLTISGFLNVGLNLFFVIVCRMDVAGVAIASVISQYVSALCCIVVLARTEQIYRLRRSELRIHPRIAKQILKIGLPAGLANAIFYIANLFVQYGINTFDAITVEGNAAAMNADGLAYDAMAAFYTAGASYVGQNYGAGKRDRVIRSFRVMVLYAFVSGLVIGITLVLFGRPFLSLFTSETAVIDAGMYRLMVMGLSYGFSALMDGSIAASRGVGRSAVPTVIVILGSCVFRIIWIFTIFLYFHTIPSLYLLYICSWSITGIAEWLYFRHAFRQLSGHSALI